VVPIGLCSRRNTLVASACRHFLKDLGEYLDGNLTALARADFDRHFEACFQCRILRDTIRKMLQFYKSTQARPIPSDVEARLMEAIEELGGECRELFLLKIEGFSYGEIKGKMGLGTMSNVYVRDHRCRERIIRILKQGGAL